MAIIKNINRILPIIPGYVVYESGGKIIVRSKSTVDSKKRNTDPAYAEIRKNNRIFGQAATLNKFIRRAIAPLIFNFGDSSSCAKLQTFCYAAIRNHMVNHYCEPNSGERSIARFVLRDNGKPLLDFCFGEQKFDTVCHVKDLLLGIDSEQTKLRWDFSNLKEILGNVPEKATHVRLLLGGVKVPPEEVVFSGNIPPGIFSKIIYRDSFSDAIPLDTFAGTALPLCLKLTDTMALGKYDSLLVVAGIVFFRESNKMFEQMTPQSVVCFTGIF